MRSERMLKPKEPVIGNVISWLDVLAQPVRMELFSNRNEVPHKSCSHFPPKQAHDLEEAGKCQYVCGPRQRTGVQDLQDDRTDHRVKRESQTNCHDGLGHSEVGAGPD